jgi:pimeloyl-ACP methyl ester carboxylesterase
MPRLARPDGVELHWEERGEGPPLVLAPYWSGHPGVYEALLADLASDHRVVTWDARGTGESTPAGPYDMETDCSDLEAILETARRPPRGDGRAAAVIAIADGANRAVHVAASRPELVAAVIAFGTGPLARIHLEGSEGMVASDAVVGAFIEMLERDYRGALRSLLSATNAQMSDAELRERVGRQISYCPQEPAAARVRAWAADDPTAASQETGGRLWILSAPDVAGPWLPPEDERRRLIEALTPKAHVEEGEAGAGPISQPGVSAATIRRITESLRLESSR